MAPQVALLAVANIDFFNSGRLAVGGARTRRPADLSAGQRHHLKHRFMTGTRFDVSPFFFVFGDGWLLLFIERFVHCVRLDSLNRVDLTPSEFASLQGVLAYLIGIARRTQI